MASHGKKLILLVEDNEDDILLARRAVAKLGGTTELVVARSGREAMGLFMGNGLFTKKDALHNVVLILLDLKMPGMNGLVLLHFFRTQARTLETPVVVVSASKEEVDELESRDLGALAFIHKPLTPGKLAELLTLHCLQDD